jgi:hypothetical protein
VTLIVKRIRAKRRGDLNDRLGFVSNRGLRFAGGCFGVLEVAEWVHLAEFLGKTQAVGCL